jgi:HPt (histidine-containing phosphotransfer) domain-containing protein
MTGQEPATGDTPFDADRLQQATLGDDALRSELMVMFARQIEETVAAMQACTGRERWRLAHGIKGAARGLGANALADCAAAIERDPDDEASLRRFVDLAGEVRAFIIREYM